MKSIVLPDEQMCCGCSACYAACPCNAIKMLEDSEGFLQPRIDESLCTKCGLCETVCPVLNTGAASSPVSTVVAKAGNDKIRFRSSSGGIFPLLAQEVLRQGGVVYGAGWERPAMRVVHKKAEDAQGLLELQGSKYVQSDMGNTFRAVRHDLLKDDLVLFSGCPCQVAGLKSFLGKEYAKLICMDVVCHSVGSPGIFRRFLWHLSQTRGEIKKITFRLKELAWRAFHFSVDFQDGSCYTVPFNDTFYALAWWSGLGARRCCFECKFKGFRNQADITVGDAWGIERFAPELDDGKGASVVYILEPKPMIDRALALCEMKEVNFAATVTKNPCVLTSPQFLVGNGGGVARNSFYKALNSVPQGLSDKVLRWFDKPSLVHRCWRKGLRMLRVLK